MTPTPLSLSNSSQLQARACRWVGTCLIGLFLVNLLGSFLPPKLLDPDWQLVLAGNLIDNGGYPLLGLLLVSLSSFLDPDDTSLQSRQLRWRSLACWVSVAYLLLIPLIGLACKRGIDQATLALQRETRTAQEAIVTMRGVIQQAGTFPELQARFRQLQAPALPPDAASIPLSDLKSGLLERLETNENALKARLQQPLVGRFLPILQKALRNILGCMVLTVGFAALALPKGASRSQLQSWAAAISGIQLRKLSLLRRWRTWREAGQQRREAAQRMAALRRARLQAERSSTSASNASKPRSRTLWGWLGNRRRRVASRIHDYDYLRQISSAADDQDRNR